MAIGHTQIRPLQNPRSGPPNVHYLLIHKSFTLERKKERKKERNEWVSLSLLHQFCSFLLSTEFPHISQNFLISELLCHVLLKALYSINTLYMTQKVHLLITLLTLFFVCFSSVFKLFFWGVFFKINLLFFLLCWSQGTGLHYRRVQDYFLCPAKKTKEKNRI
jgi:hypothetical protein